MVKNDFTTPMYLMKAGVLHQQAGNWTMRKRRSTDRQGIPHQQ
jgi:hypothetical protein